MTGLQALFVILAGYAFLKWLCEFLPMPWGAGVTFIDNWMLAMFGTIVVILFIGFKGWY